jgi:hypothetical protein
VNIYSLNIYVVNLKWKFIYLGRRPSPSPLLSPDVLADVDVIDLKLSIISHLPLVVPATTNDQMETRFKEKGVHLFFVFSDRRSRGWERERRACLYT